MGRLQYTGINSMLRRIAMSRKTSLYVFVEGKVNDPFLADFLCSTSPAIREAGYEIRQVSEIASAPTPSGGKATAIGLFDHCKRANKLVQENSRGKRSIAFFLDRDAQHITGGRRRSPHVIYTIEADAEAHLFADSDEVSALAVALTVPQSEAKKVANGIGDWRRRLADDWRPWIELCYLAEAERSRCWVGFGKGRSLIHVGQGIGSLDPSIYSAAEAEIEKTSLFSGDRYKQISDRTLKAVTAQYARGTQARLLKGKWLPMAIAHYVTEYFASKGVPSSEWKSKDFPSAATTAYTARLRSDSKSISLLRRKLEVLVPSASAGLVPQRV